MANQAPVVTTSGGSTSYIEGTPVAIDAAITVTDEINANLASATVSITTGFGASQDLLQFINQNGITGSYNAATGVLSLTGSDNSCRLSNGITKCFIQQQFINPKYSRTAP